MTSLDKAKRFLADKTRAIALAALPLAALVAISATPAKATIVGINLNFGSPGNCVVASTPGNGSVAGTCTAASISQPSGPNGLKIYTGSDPLFNVITSTLNPGSGEAFGAILSTTGLLTGTYFGSLPIAYDFTTKSGANPLTGINFVLQISLNNGVNYQTLASLPSTTLSHTTGTGSLTLAGSYGTNYILQAIFQYTNTSYPGSVPSFTVFVPTNSLDVNPALSSIPEPSAFFLVIPGLGVLALARRKRA